MRASKGIHLEDITESLKKYEPEASLESLLKAYAFASKAHGGQVRLSGQAYMSHPMEVALILTSLKMPPSVLTTALLHDTVEDTEISVEDIERNFGKEVAHMVEGLTKIGKIKFRSREERQAENVRKMILALSEDIRIVVIKLADRLHNMRTLEYLPPERQRAISDETLNIYAPIANRLGISWLRRELEDIAFKYVHPVEYGKLIKLTKEYEEEADRVILSACSRVKEGLLKERIAAEVSGRTKGLYAIYIKMLDQNLDFNQIYDIIGIRVITKSVVDCYGALGIVHSLWKPIHGKLKDYIALPKENMYQSLHTTILMNTGQRVEFQLRTQQMHIVSEEGFAAHWHYKDGGNSPVDTNKSLFWVQRLIDLGNDLDDSQEFLENVKTDLFPDEVYVFTPQQEVKAFPRGATPIDFAYAVHTEIGNRCIGALVNNQEVRLDYTLENGDVVEVITLDTQKPSKDWLKIAKTSHARSKILSNIRTRERSDAVRLGQEIIEAELSKYSFPPEQYFTLPALEEASKALGFKNSELFLQRVGFYKIPLQTVLQKLLPAKEFKSFETAKKRPLNRIMKKLSWGKAEKNVGVRVSVGENMLVNLARCCNPVPGDAIAGYSTGEKGLIIHCKGCPTLKKLEPNIERFVDAQWEENLKKQLYHSSIMVHSLNRPWILANISTAIANCKANIYDAVVSPTGNSTGKLKLTVEVENLSHLKAMLETVKKVDGVKSVVRLMESEE